MPRKSASVIRKRRSKVFDPATVEALAKLRRLAQSADDRPRVIDQVVELRKRGVQLRVLAECCGVAVSTISQWQDRVTRSGPAPARRNLKQRLPAERVPQMQVIDVVRPGRVAGLCPKINLRAEWVRVRLSLELV